MKVRVSRINVLKSIVAAAVVATIPQMVQASGSQTKTVTTKATTSVSTKTAESVEISDLKRQLFLCQQHKHHRQHRRAYFVPKKTAQVIERTTIIEKPVIIEKVVEKQIFVDRPAEIAVEKQVVVESPVEVQKTILVEHSKHRRHLLHFGIPFLGSVTLF